MRNTVDLLGDTLMNADSLKKYCRKYYSKLQKN